MTELSKKTCLYPLGGTLSARVLQIDHKLPYTKQRILLRNHLPFNLPLCNFFWHTAFLPITKSHWDLSWHFLKLLVLGEGTMGGRSAMSGRLGVWEISLRQQSWKESC